MQKKSVFLAVAASVLFGTPALAQDEEEAADLQSYSVGDRRGGPVAEEKVVIERPKFENSFKFEAPKPNLSGIRISKPKLQVMPQSPPQSAAAQGSESNTRTAQAGGPGASPAVDSAAPRGESRPVRPLKMDPPEYPRAALINGEEGFVVLEFTIGVDGSTSDITVVNSKPRNTFDREAQRAAARWTFEPAMRDGRLVSQRIRHTVEFTLSQ